MELCRLLDAMHPRRGREMSAAAETNETEEHFGAAGMPLMAMAPVGSLVVHTLMPKRAVLLSSSLTWLQGGGDGGGGQREVGARAMLFWRFLSTSSQALMMSRSSSKESKREAFGIVW